jgi:ribulose-phosphate 3-epimerase
MIEAPDRYIADFAKAGAAYISVQVEACIHLNRTIQHIRETGARPGVVLNPSTPLESLAWVLGDVEFVLIMSVNPGFGGQTFIPGSLDKIKALRKMITDRGLATMIQIDGGVNPENIQSIAQAGADVCVAGSAIYGTRDYKKTMDDFRRRLAG